MKKVGIIGGAGFIGSHTTQKFLTAGYHVRVSASDPANSAKYEHLHSFPHSDRVELKPLDVQNKDQLRAFVDGCDIVVHGGTPFQLAVNDPKTELFDPTINGTKNFLEIVRETPSVRKVVIIASVAAYNTNYPMPADGKGPEDTTDESDIPYLNQEGHPYSQAKFYAHQAVQEFIKNNTSEQVEITSVLPTWVVGKSLSNREDSTSSGLQFLMKNNIAPDPFVQMLYDNDVEFAVVDVKDVAEGIYKASITSGLHGKNYFLTSESWKVSDIKAMLNNEQPKNSARIVYLNNAAQQDLGIHFNPAQIPLNAFGKQ